MTRSQHAVSVCLVRVVFMFSILRRGACVLALATITAGLRPTVRPTEPQMASIHTHLDQVGLGGVGLGLERFGRLAQAACWNAL